MPVQRWGRIGMAAGLALVGACVLLLVSIQAQVRPSSADLKGLFFAPSMVGEGEATLLLGVPRPIDGEVSVLGIAGGVVERTERLSPYAFRVSISVLAGASELELKVLSGIEQVDLRIPIGAYQEKLTVWTNLPESTLHDRKLVTHSPTFIYSFMPTEGKNLGGIRIFNESTGIWYWRDLEEKPIPPAHVLYVDSDGDQILDIEDPEEATVTNDFIGVQLNPGINQLFLVSFTREGNSVLEALEVILEQP